MKNICVFIFAGMLGLSAAMTISARLDLEKCQSKYDKLQADVQAVFGNERPSEESLANVKDVIKSVYEKNEENRRLREETIMLKHQLENMISDRKEVMSHLIKARQENRLLQTEIEILQQNKNN